MINSFKYVFVETKPSWFIGSFYHFLSFSSDGTTIAGSTIAGSKRANDNSRSRICSEVQFWETATGTATFLIERSRFVVFSPTVPDKAALVRSESIHIEKRDSFGGKTWGGQYKIQSNPGALCSFNSNGETIVVLKDRRYLDEYDAITFKSKSGPFECLWMTGVVCCPIKPGWFAVGGSLGELDIVSSNATVKHIFKSYCRLTPLEPVEVSACAWSQDGKWIATGNDHGDTFLWNARFPSSVTFAMLLPRNRPNTSKCTIFRATTSLAFVPDSTALIIISGGYLSVWDIEKAEYVANSGLPDTAMNIALDGPRNRLAVAANDRITIYELKPAEQMCQMDGKSSIPSDLAEFDITNEVVKFDPKPLVGLYFDTYRGVCKLHTPRAFQFVVAIKALHPVIKARDNAPHEQQEFEDVSKLNFVRFDMQ